MVCDLTLGVDVLHVLGGESGFVLEVAAVVGVPGLDHEAVREPSCHAVGAEEDGLDLVHRDGDEDGVHSRSGVLRRYRQTHGGR